MTGLEAGRPQVPQDQSLPQREAEATPQTLFEQLCAIAEAGRIQGADFVIKFKRLIDYDNKPSRITVDICDATGSPFMNVDVNAYGIVRGPFPPIFDDDDKYPIDRETPLTYWNWQMSAEERHSYETDQLQKLVDFVRAQMPPEEEKPNMHDQLVASAREKFFAQEKLNEREPYFTFSAASDAIAESGMPGIEIFCAIKDHATIQPYHSVKVFNDAETWDKLVNDANVVIIEAGLANDKLVFRENNRRYDLLE